MMIMWFSNRPLLPHGLTLLSRNFLNCTRLSRTSTRVISHAHALCSWRAHNIYIYFMSSLNSTTAGALPRRPMTPQRRLEVPSFICDLWQQNASYLWWFTICSDSFSLYSRAFDIGPTQWRPVFQPYPTCFEPHMFNYNKKSLATTAEKLHLFNFFLLLPVLLAILASISFTYQFVNNVEKQQQSLS